MLSEHDLSIFEELLRRREREVLAQLSRIRTAFQRLKDGTFGECVVCGEPIERRRLEVAPESPVCMPCQREAE